MLLLALTLLACGDKDADSGDAGLDPTMANVQAEVFAKSCAFSSCHGEGGGSADLDLSSAEVSHAQLVGVASTKAESETRVVAGSTADSYLWTKLQAHDDGTAVIEGDPMPPSAPLADDQLALVQGWIEAGAPAE
ncbi:MAG: hypothetical protein H6742_03670 [Alphaproteobacteria bacterium]|nr:hypothetical protein [Alphaproteobacteria bacterium]